MEPEPLQEKVVTTLIETSPEYSKKFKNLFYDKKSKSISQKHLESHIIINPSAIFTLIAVKDNSEVQLKDTLKNWGGHSLKLKLKIYRVILYLLQKFNLNCYLIHNEVIQEDQSDQDRRNFFAHVLDEYYSADERMRISRDIPNGKRMQDEEDTSSDINAPDQIHQYLAETLFKILETMLAHCMMVKKDLQRIPQKLVAHFYNSKLTEQLIKANFQLFLGGVETRKQTPYIYFLNWHNDAIKVLLKNNKWPFSKGMTMFLWFKVLKPCKSKLVWLKTEDNNQIIVNVTKDNKLTVKCIYKEKQSPECEVQICPLPMNILHCLSIQLQPTYESMFKSPQYVLHVSLNNSVYREVKISIPRFSSFQFITQLSCFHKFIGNFYSLLVTNKCDSDKQEHLLQFPQGLATEEDVESFKLQKVIPEENIMCVFNVDRAFRGTLINYSGENNQGCYSGGVVKQKFVSRTVEQANALLPYLYFLNLIPKQQISTHFSALYDKIFRTYVQIMLNTTQPQNISLLFCLYFLELSEYKVSDTTIKWLLGIQKSVDNFYLSLVRRFIDLHTLHDRKIIIDPFQVDINPVEKLQLLFYLESEWKNKWNQLQGFEGWWQPPFFTPQNDQPYRPDQYLHKQKQIIYEWSVRNFISNDYCRCLLEPLFKVPEKANLTKYAQQYLKKGIMNQSFQEKLQFVNRDGTNDLQFQKKSKSRFDRLKQKIGRGQKQTQIRQYKSFDIKETLVTECCHIALLTNIMGELRLTQQGYLVFTMKHSSKQFDHMCVKAFQNQTFVRVSMHLSEVILIRRRRYNLSTSAIEIKLKSGQIHLFYFFHKNLQKCIQVLEKHVPVRKSPYQYYLESEVPIEWIDKDISNYEYLMWLNDAAGRSYSDITQYPVLPWITISNQLQLQIPPESAFRELSKNMGSIGPQQRIQHFLQKYQSYNESEIFNEYHFGTHYSSSAIIFNYLIRVHPFSLGALTLQSGKFDVADRVFGNYFGSWINATTSPTDVRELVPEIYTLPEMMFNKNNYNFGLTQTKQRIDNVQLPIWADKNPFKFIVKVRQLFQSEYVSKNINNWIDLIFGYKQRGTEAVKHMNIFFPLTYEDALVVDNIEDKDERISIETQIAHFGQNPCQVIGNNPHPLRFQTQTAWEGKLLPDLNAEIIVRKFTVAKNSVKEHNQLFGSVFEGKDSIISIRFINENWFIVLQKHQYLLFKVLDKKGDCISKQMEIQYALESQHVKFDYRNLNNFVPTVVVKQKTVIVGGYYSGYVHMVFINEGRYNQFFKFPHLSTITAMAYDDTYSFLYIGDSDGRFVVYELVIGGKKIEFLRVKYVISNSGKINCIQANHLANLIAVCGQDGRINIYNMYSLELFRVLKSPKEHPINFAVLSTCPLYSVYFYCQSAGKVYSYSLNGQYLDEVQQESGFLYNMKILKSSSKMDCLSYVDNSKQLRIYQTPFLRLRKKVKIRKDMRKVSCIESPSNSKMLVAGSQDGFLHLIGDKKWL